MEHPISLCRRSLSKFANLCDNKEMKNFNEKLARFITKNVATMYCAYLFGIIGLSGCYFAFTGNAKGVLIIGSVSGYFLQLFLLPVIMVGQSIHTESIKKHVSKVHKQSKKLT